jgi:hypothetical protein
MGLFIFSFVVSIVISGAVWLLVGDRLPPGETVKWDSRKNMLCYMGISFAFVYLLVFFLF